MIHRHESNPRQGAWSRGFEWRTPQLCKALLCSRDTGEFGDMHDWDI